jgi:hypothetical protein
MLGELGSGEPAFLTTYIHLNASKVKQGSQSRTVQRKYIKESKPTVSTDHSVHLASNYRVPGVYINAAPQGCPRGPLASC